MVPRVEPRLQPPPTPRNQSSNSAKHSTRSYSSSFEADDERSSTADHDSMGPNSAAGFRDEPSQYEGEDIRLTSRKELSGWYAYAFAAEVFVICGMGELKFPGRCVVRGVVDGFCCKCFQRPGPATDVISNGFYEDYTGFVSLLTSINCRIIHTYHPRTARQREWCPFERS
jgi:hypothetical protein